MTTTRTEHDTLGAVQVPDAMYWGAQTQRSLENFAIGHEKMPPQVLEALALIKKSAALVNMELGHLDSQAGEALVTACDAMLAGKLAGNFPLAVWQTGSGTQTNMNVNEVLANYANALLGQPRGSHAPLHPNDHVNKSQSSNDTFPTAMHVATVLTFLGHLDPALEVFQVALEAKAKDFSGLIKIGRTHLQDATPLTLGQEFSGYAAQVALARQRLHQGLVPLYALAQGGTAVGTGLNAPKDFGPRVAHHLARMTGVPFVTAENKFQALASHDDLVSFSGILTSLATACFKIANDIRLLASGPRSGLGELELPANEPGSSIMPGKINPTQCEALTMVCAQVMGNHTTITFAGSQGHLELNVYKPVIIYNLLQSLVLLADGISSFHRHALAGLKPLPQGLQRHMESSLMLVTALAPHIGYDKAAAMAKYAHTQGLTLRSAAVSLGYVTEEEFEAWVRPEDMV